MKPRRERSPRHRPSVQPNRLTVPGQGTDARRLAIAALVRVAEQGAYANLLLPSMLDRSSLDRRDRALATELVYGTVRMRRACDWLVDRFLLRDVEPAVRAALRIGAYQLHFLEMPAHAAVSATVAAAPPRARGLVNAVLRRVASADVTWPDDATRLSYPDSIVQALRADLGPADAMAALEAMNRPPSVTERADGYVQDVASQWVVDLTGVEQGEMVADLCAAPGGKATGMAAAGAWVAAGDTARGRVGLLVGNAKRLGLSDRVRPLVADAANPPLRPGSFDRVLLDAPCSGLGVLRRRPDARWRFDPSAVDRLERLQAAMAVAAAELVRPGGVLVYSVCTLTAAETLGVDELLSCERPDLFPLAPPGAPWRPHGRGALLLPQSAGTDGMFLLRLRRTSAVAE